MSGARQTVIRVRSDQTYLAAAVEAVVQPKAISHARKIIARANNRERGRSGAVRTTFCPICGGNKGRTAARCQECRNLAMRRGRAEAASAGHESLGRTSSARSLLGEAITRDNPSQGEQTTGPTSSRRVRGEGVLHVQPWERQVLVNGVWMPERQTPEGKERAATDREALTRLAAIDDRRVVARCGRCGFAEATVLADGGTICERCRAICRPVDR